jgi:5-methylthioadenosine/S-adenosylhomocysteine deaminase
MARPLMSAAPWKPGFQSLGADWAPRGSKNLLGEMKIARFVSQHEHGFLSDRAIVEMVTCVPAKMIGWQNLLGSLEVGRKADLVAIAGKNMPPYTDLIDATEADLITGSHRRQTAPRPRRYIGPSPPKNGTRPGGVTDFLIDLTEPNDDPLEGLRLDTQSRN